MSFVQIIEFRSDRIEEGRKHIDAYLEATEGRRTTQRSLLCQDRDNPGRFLNIVFFDSYESAMKNSEMPETGELAARLADLADGPPAFSNLDVVWDET